MSSKWMLRAAAEPERFLARGFTRIVSPKGDVADVRPGLRRALPDLGLTVPRDLERFLRALVRRPRVGDFVARPSLPSFATLVSNAKRSASAFARLTAVLADAIPFGETEGGSHYLYFTGSPLQGLVATLDPETMEAKLLCRGAAELAVICSFQIEDGSRPNLDPFDDGDDASVSEAIANAQRLAEALTGHDARVRSVAREVPQRSVLGAMLESFFFDANVELHPQSPARIVREASTLLRSALASPRSAAARDLARRREVVRRVVERRPRISLDTTRAIIARLDTLPISTESFAVARERDELLLALEEVGDRRILPELRDRAEEGDIAAVDMIAAFGDRSTTASLIELLGAEAGRIRLHEAAIVRALAAARVEEALPALRQLLDENPMSGWREGLERGVLVRELVTALGDLEDAASANHLLAIVESTSHEYRAIVPLAALALGRLRHAPALAAIERRLVSPKDTVTCEAVWTVGALAEAHVDLRPRAITLLERVSGIDPAIEVTRLVALAKARGGKLKVAPIRRAIDRALWEPAYRQEETSRRRAWAFLALEELAAFAKNRIEGGGFFLGREAVLHFVTRDDHRVRKAALRAFTAWGLDVPETHPYFAFSVAELEERDGLAALLEAVEDDHGIFRHNIATRLAEIGDPRVVGPLAAVTDALVSEPPTSTYEYDDAPPEIVAFVRALAKLNVPKGNDILIAALGSDNHHVRAVVADNVPADERFVPELMVMLGDSRSFLRSRAEKALTSLGALAPPADLNTTEIVAVKPVVALRNEA